MSATKINWTHHTWNCVTGCTQISHGCANCYAKRLSKRLQAMQPLKYRNGFEPTMHPQCVTEPLGMARGKMIFLNSMSDTFHPAVTDEFIFAMFAVMQRCPQHLFQVLTKRSDRLLQMSLILPRLSNVWWGVTVENGDYLHRIDDLRSRPTGWPIINEEGQLILPETRSRNFLSCEPLLGPLPNLNLAGIDWVIVGGESGPGARPMNPAWARDIRAQCLAAGVPFFLKQLGGSGKGKGGRMLDGREWNMVPAHHVQPKKPRAARTKSKGKVK